MFRQPQNLVQLNKQHSIQFPKIIKMMSIIGKVGAPSPDLIEGSCPVAGVGVELGALQGAGGGGAGARA